MQSFDGIQNAQVWISPTVNADGKYVLWCLVFIRSFIRSFVLDFHSILTLKFVALLPYFILKLYLYLFKLSYFLLRPCRERNAFAI